MAGEAPARESLLEGGAKILCDYVESAWADSQQKTVELASPDELLDAFRQNGVSIELGGEGASEKSVLEACRLALKYSVKSNHALFFNQLYGRVEPVGLLGQWLTSATAGNCHTYEVAPVFTLTELHTIRKLASAIRYPEKAEGLFVPGGSISNLYGMHLARYRAFPQAKTEGLWGCPPLVAFCSSHAHYSYSKATHVLGLGLNNLVKVATDRRGRMLPDELEKAVEGCIKAGKKPFFVGATAGSTVLGAFDDFNALRQICNKHSIWLHVDGCWGGVAVLSGRPDVQALVSGIETSDSCAWNPHKLMGVPMQCSAFLTQHSGLLLECNRSNAAYLFQPDKKNTEMDIGDKTIQCGRLPDSFKLWLAWKHIGDNGWVHRMDKAVHLMEHMHKRMLNGPWNGRFQVVVEPSFTNLCFWYFPKSMEAFDPHTSSPESEQYKNLHAVAPAIKAKMQEHGRGLIGFQSITLDGDIPLPNFFRMVFASVQIIEESHVEMTLKDIDVFGSDIFAKL